MKKLTLLSTLIFALYACSSSEEPPIQTNDGQAMTNDFIQFGSITPTTSNVLPSIGGAFEETLNSPGAVIKIDDVYYLFYNDYVGGWPPKDVRIGYASSTDLTSWSRNPEITLSGEHVNYLDGVSEHPSVSSAFVKGDGTIVMYFDIFKKGKGVGVGMATANDIDGPWTVHPTPVIEPTAGAWDEHGMASSEVVSIQGGYRMYYGVFMEDLVNPEMGIGMAESADGINWEKHDGAVFSKGPSGAWDAYKVEVPRIIQTDKGWVMAYRSDAGAASWGDGTGYGIATSQDGVSWERFQEEAVIHENYFSWATIWATAFYKESGTYYLFAETDGPPAPGTRINVYSYSGDFFE